MSRHRPFRFGVLSRGAHSREAWLAQARHAEGFGYTTLSVGDHLDTELAPIAAIATAAEATTTLRLGCGVFANDFRHPVVLAKEAASLDVLTDGRFELGLGTGYWRADYAQSGIPFDPPGVRVDRLTEAVRIIKAMFGAGPVTVGGTHYTVRDLDLRPKPVQQPHPPLLIGGGSRRILTLAAQEADIVGINPKTTADGGFDFRSITPEATARKVAWVREAAGDRFDRLELHTLAPFVAVTDDPRRTAAEVLQAWGIADSMSIDELLVTPHTLIGSEEQVVETLHACRAHYGISYVTVFEPAMAAFAPIVTRLTGR